MLELTSVSKVVTDSEGLECRDSSRKFSYKLNEKTAKSKMIKGAKRLPFEIEENSSSMNLIFNLGAWSEVVLPSLMYWNNAKENKTCRINENEVKILDVKVGKEINGSHIDTQVIFMMNKDKICTTSVLTRSDSM